MAEPTTELAVTQVQDAIAGLLQERPADAPQILAVGLLISAAALYLAEKDSHGLINTYGDALWNATTTVAALGESGCPPVTPAGRLVGALLLAAGCPLFDRTKAAVGRAYDALSHTSAPPTHVCGSGELVERLDLILQRLTELCEALPAVRPVSAEPTTEAP